MVGVGPALKSCENEWQMQSLPFPVPARIVLYENEVKMNLLLIIDIISRAR